MVEDALLKLKKHMDEIDKNIQKRPITASDFSNSGPWVPMEVWKLTNSVYMETLREIYDMIHQMNIERGFSMDVQIGDVHINLSGDSKDRDAITQKGQEMINSVFDKISQLGDAAMKLVAARERERRKVDESNKGFG